MRGIGGVIVTYNSEDVIGACLDSALPRVERLVVVDNASSDATLDEVRKRPRAALIANVENLGFAAAVNQGFRRLDCPLVLILNPDVTLQTGLGPLAQACREPGVAVAAGKLVDERGRPQRGFSVRRFPKPSSLGFEVLGLNRIWPGNPVNQRYRCADLDLEAEAEVEQPAGAFLLIRRDVWEAVGGFDEEFRPLWFEDVDFLHRVSGRGYRTRYVPSAVAEHKGGHSVTQLSSESRAVCWYASLLRYAFKHFQAGGRVAVWSAVVAGCTIRMLGVFLGQWKLWPLRVYCKVIRLACLRLVSGRIGESGVVPVLARQ
jgi:hypothetical protein